jgi:hypothetical protein
MTYSPYCGPCYGFCCALCCVPWPCFAWSHSQQWQQQQLLLLPLFGQLAAQQVLLQLPGCARHTPLLLLPALLLQLLGQQLQRWMVQGCCRLH